MDGLIIGKLKYRLDNYRAIVEDLLKDRQLTTKQKDFLRKEKILK